MKILMISLDSSIFELNSAASGRMKDYGSICKELHIVVLKAGPQKTAISQNVFAYSAGPSRLFSICRALKNGKQIIKQSPGKWVITSQDPFETGFIAWRLAKKFNAGLEIQMHGDFYSNDYWRKEKLLNKLRYCLGKFILRRADSVRVVSERIKKSICGFTKARICEISVLSNIKQEGGADFLKNKFPDSFPIILAVGNLVPVKNHKLLIKAFADIKKELPSAKLIIVGEGSLRKILQAISYKLQADVEFAGHQKNLADYYSSADIFVHPSFYEGWGRAVIEAAQFGLPIVMPDVGLAGEIIKNNESGLVVPINDKETLKNAIIKLAKDGMLRKRLGAGAKRVISESLNKEQYLNKIKKSWEALI